MKTGEGEAGSGGGCEHSALVAAYLDRELAPDSTARFEAHAAGCPACSAALLEQRRLLCLLDAAFDQNFGQVPPLPRDFTRAVKARAQTDMSGVRDARERRRALKICAALGLAAFALLGYAAFDAVTGPALSAASAASGMLGVAGRASAEAGAGTGVVLRAVASRLVSGSAVALVLLLAAGLLLLRRLISGYHRAAARD